MIEGGFDVDADASPGRVAAKVAPFVGPPPPMQVTDSGVTGAGLLAALRRCAYVGFGLLTAFLVLTVIVVAAAVGPIPPLTVVVGSSV